VIAGASIVLPEFLQKFDILLSKGNIVLIRVSVPLLILWLGTLGVLLVVVQHSKTLKSQKQPIPDSSDADRLNRKVRMLIERMENEKNKCPDSSARTTMHHTQEDLEEISTDLKSISHHEKNHT